MSKNKWGMEIAPERICAIDASTNSLAYATFHDGNLKEVGKSIMYLQVIKAQAKFN